MGGYRKVDNVYKSCDRNRYKKEVIRKENKDKTKCFIEILNKSKEALGDRRE